MNSIIKYLYKLYVPLIFILYINSMYPWYVLNTSVNLVFTGLTAVVAVFLLLLSPSTGREIRDNKTLFLLLTIFAVYMMAQSNANGMINWLALYVVYTSILAADLKTKEELLRFITKWMAILVTVSMVVYLLWMFRVIHMNPQVIEFGDIGAYKRDNYFFFMVGDDGRLAHFYRFAAIFLEPGHMTMGAVPLIVLNRFRFKNIYVLLLTVEVFLSFSLAGIITIILGYGLLNFNRKFLISMVVGFAILGGLIWGIEKAGYGKVLETFLWERIEFKDGTIRGYNRTTAKFDKQFDKVANSSEIFFGSPRTERNMEVFGNAGYKVYIVQYGIVGLILALIIYCYFMFKEQKYIVTAVTIIYLLLLFQNSYPAWMCVLGSYLFGMPCIAASSGKNSSLENKDERSLSDKSLEI